MLKFMQVNKVSPVQFDQVIAPVRSLRSPHLWMEQVPALAPIFGSVSQISGFAERELLESGVF